MYSLSLLSHTHTHTHQEDFCCCYRMDSPKPSLMDIFMAGCELGSSSHRGLAEERLAGEGSAATIGSGLLETLVGVGGGVVVTGKVAVVRTAELVVVLEELVQ